MASGEWMTVTDESPCEVCGKPDWCSIAADASAAICRRLDNGQGAHKVDRAGQSYWLYRRNGTPLPAPPELLAPPPGSAPLDKADPQTLDTVYGALLGKLELNETNRRDLLRRGLTETQIAHQGYRSLPRYGREALAAELVDEFGEHACSRVPGLYRGPETDRWSLAGASGLLVPVRDALGRVIALKARADNPGDGPRYSCLSSAKHGGPGPGAQVHIPLHDEPLSETVRLTEGELKADIATTPSGIVTISAPGVSAWQGALAVLSELNPRVVLLAFDADASENPVVARALSGAYQALVEQGFEVRGERWPLEHGKGIDDLLAAGHQPEVLTGPEAHTAACSPPAQDGDRNGRGSTLTAAALMEMEYPKPKWIVPGLLPEGATILGGKPKMGKSWLALGIATAVASGGAALGTSPVEKGTVLYLALEDNYRRLQSRLKKLLAGTPAPATLELATQWPRLSESGLDMLEAWLVAHPDARLIVVDTLAKVRNGGSGQNLYREDYEAMEPLLGLAAQYNVGVLIVHHLRKLAADDPLDEVSGSIGLTGGVDGALVLKRERGRADAYLYVTGRDIEQEQELALIWEAATATWRIAGEACEYRMSRERQEILDCLRNQGAPASPKEVSEIIGKPRNSVKQLLYQMASDGIVRNIGGGKYVITDNLHNQDNRDDLSSEAPPPEAGHCLQEAPLHQEDESPVTAVSEVTGDEQALDNRAAPDAVATQEALDSVAEELKEAEIVGVDLETTGLSPRMDKVRLISLSTKKSTYLVDCFQVDPTPLFPVLVEKQLAFHNALFDLGFLTALGFELGDKSQVLDTMLMSQLLQDKEAS